MSNSAQHFHRSNVITYRPTTKEAVTRVCLVIEFLCGMFFGIPIMATYYYSLGLSPTDVLVLQSVISITSVVAEIPTGYPCDRFGARPVIIVGLVGLAVFSVLFGQSQTFWQFAAVLVITSVCWSLLSGAASTLIHTIYGLDASYRYDQATVHASTAGKFAGTALGAAIVSYADMNLPYLLQPIPYAIASLVALGLPKQKARRYSKSAKTLVWQLVKSMLWHNRHTRWSTLFFALQYSVALSSFWILQLQLEQAAWKVQQYGLFYLAIFTIIVVVAWAMKLCKKYRPVTQMWLLYGMTGLCILAAATMGQKAMPWLSGMVFCLYSALAMPMLRIQLRTLSTTDELPTTELSVASACGLLLFAGMGPIIGEIASELSLGAANLVLGIVLLVGGGISLFSLQRA